MKFIDEGIKNALNLAGRDYGSILSLSRKIGVSHSTVIFWKSGKTKAIDGDVWRYKVYPVLRPYLSPCLDSSFEISSVKTEPVLAAHDSQELTAASTLYSVPVISFAQATGFDPVMEPFEIYAKSMADEEVLFATRPGKGYFALKVEGQSMEPEFPHGTLVLVAGGEFVQNGDICVARLRSNGQVIIKEFNKSANICQLNSLNPEGASFSWDCVNERGFIEWMHPVIEAKISLRDRNKLKHKQA